MGEDWKRYFFFVYFLLITLNLTENDNCKHYGEYDYDRKRLQTFRLTENITDYYLYLQIDWEHY